MKKIICDVCGTQYPETAEQCPICGCPRPDTPETSDDEMLHRTGAFKARGGRFSENNVKKRSRCQVPTPEEVLEEADDGEEEEEITGHPLINTLLSVLIAILLIAIGFFTFKYLVPNLFVNEDPLLSATEPSEPETEPAETEAPTVPCTGLVLTDSKAELTMPGQPWLLNVMVFPSDTTDDITYVSSDESVVTVNEQGRVTAVGEGEATVTIICGEIRLQCRVTCDFPEVPTDPEETAAG